MNDKAVSERTVRERYEQAKEAFEGPVKDGEQQEDYDLGWITGLTKDGNDRLEKTINNMVLILENDPLLKGKIVTDEFASCGMALGKLPWDQRDEKRRWRDVDDAGFYRYMETYYGLTGREKLDNALLICSAQNRINDVKQYLQGLSWDGKKRLDSLLIDYLGAEDNIYTRVVMKKALCAAVARAIIGGVKFDYMPILVGAQGIGKSTFLAMLGKDWFSDSLTTFEGKEAAELIQGTWINEIGELTAFTKQETQVIKQFLSKTDDIYRAAYGRRTEKYPRRCVFFGTSNEQEFLKDMTGNRRFWPVDVGLYPVKKSVWEDLPKEVDQIWAEAYVYWQLGEKLFLTKEEEAIAAAAQEEHKETSAKEGIIRDFLEKKIPVDWNSYDLTKRRMFWSRQLHCGQIRLVDRQRVCAMEIWAECFGGDPRFIQRRDSAEINGIMAGLREWEREKTPGRHGAYGPQRGFKKCLQTMSTK